MVVVVLRMRRHVFRRQFVAGVSITFMIGYTVDWTCFWSFLTFSHVFRRNTFRRSQSRCHPIGYTVDWTCFWSFLRSAAFQGTSSRCQQLRSLQSSWAAKCKNDTSTDRHRVGCRVRVRARHAGQVCYQTRAQRDFSDCWHSQQCHELNQCQPIRSRLGGTRLTPGVLVSVMLTVRAKS